MLTYLLSGGVAVLIAALTAAGLLRRYQCCRFPDTEDGSGWRPGDFCSCRHGHVYQINAYWKWMRVRRRTYLRTMAAELDADMVELRREQA